MIYLTLTHSHAIASPVWLLSLFSLLAFAYYYFDLWLAKTRFQSIDFANLVVLNLDGYPEHMYYLTNKNNIEKNN